MAACSAHTAIRDAGHWFLNAAPAQSYGPQLAAFLKGLNEKGYADGRNVTIKYRSADGRFDRLPAMAAELVAGK
jgi:hypothetical protein